MKTRLTNNRITLIERSSRIYSIVKPKRFGIQIVAILVAENRQIIQRDGLIHKIQKHEEKHQKKYTQKFNSIVYYCIFRH